jgi:HD superfamily phosphohydrolase
MHYSFVYGDSMVMHAHAVPALEMFLTARLYLYTNIYFHRTVRRIDLTMREIFADSVQHILPGNPLDDLDGYLSLTDWSLLEAVDRWRRATPGSDERRLGEAWESITSRRLRWKLAYESLVGSDADVSDVRARVLDLLPPSLRGVDFEVDIASARVAPENPLTDDGLVAIYDPLEETVEHSRTVELLARLPKHNQIVRVFSNDENALPALHTAARSVLG